MNTFVVDMMFMRCMVERSLGLAWHDYGGNGEVLVGRGVLGSDLAFCVLLCCALRVQEMSAVF